MILMSIITAVGEDDVRLELTGEALERLLYFRELGRKESIPKRVHAQSLGRGSTQKLSCSSPRFALAFSPGTPHNPAEFGSRPPPRQREYSCTASNLNVI